MHDFIFSSINKRTFSCDMPLLHEYAQRRDDLIKVEGDIKEPFEKLYERKKLEFILNIKSELKDSFQGEFAKLKWQGCLGTISLIQNMKDILAM